MPTSWNAYSIIFFIVQTMSQPKPGGEGSDVKPPSDPPDSDLPDSGRPLSREEMTMFSPYNSLRSSEPVSQQVGGCVCRCEGSWCGEASVPL